MAQQFKHKQIVDMKYFMIGRTRAQVQLREISTGREFWLDKAEFEKHYEKV